MMNDRSHLLKILGLKVGRQMSDRKIKEALAYEETIGIEEEMGKREWERAAEKGVRILSFLEADYPAVLNELKDPPLLLWTKGDLSLLKKTVGIVGTRNATLYGREMAKSFAQTVARRGVSVVSGLARGIDTEAHSGALNGGKTVAIIGSGFNVLYPSENLQLAEKIGKEGLLISEYPLDTPPNKFQFPARNRLIAALSEKLLVVEAPLKSGSLLTAEMAHSLGRPVFALPGRVDWESFAGNHLLLKEGKAKLATSADDLVVGQSVSMSVASDGLLAFFKEVEIDVESLFQRSGLALPTLNAQLMRLVLQGKIRQLPGGMYKINKEYLG